MRFSSMLLFVFVLHRDPQRRRLVENRLLQLPVRWTGFKRFRVRDSWHALKLTVVPCLAEPQLGRRLTVQTNCTINKTG